jgi:periplasmic divalent cation tolerance protein
MENIRVVFVSTPRDEAGKLARGLVENRLAACVNIIPKIESYFWWDNKLNHDEEALLIIKTTQQRFDELRDWVVNNHPYDLPEIISLPLSDGLSEYIEWVKKETKSL